MVLNDMINNHGGLRCAGGMLCTTGIKMLEFMNDCNSPQGTPNRTTGKCTCDPTQWKGADCGLKSNKLEPDNSYAFESIGPKTFSLYFKPSDEKMVSVIISNTSVPLDIFVSKSWVKDPHYLNHSA